MVSGSNVLAMIKLDICNSSVTVITETKEVSFISTINVFDNVGIDMRRLCGRIILLNACEYVIPMDNEASIWPLSTASMEALNDSDK